VPLAGAGDLDDFIAFYEGWVGGRRTTPRGRLRNRRTQLAMAELRGDDGARQAAEAGFTFPYLVDATQEVARAYGAACTPDFFLFDAERRLVYRGQMDDSRPSSDVPVTGEDLRAALDAVLAGDPVPGEQLPSMGCGIKWKPGNEPT
jgi:hypothetical protein